MKKFFSFFLFTGFVLSLGLAPSVKAAVYVSYPTSVYSYGGDIVMPVNAAGEPDNLYTEFRDDNAYAIYKLDEPVMADVSLSYLLLDGRAGYQVTLMDASMQSVLVKSAYFITGTTALTFDGPDVPFQYVKVASFEEDRWKLESIEIDLHEAMEEETEEEVVDEPETEEENEEESTDEPEELQTLNRGRLMKLADDGNPDTHHDEAVYVVGEQKNRYAFPSSDVYFSWYEDFEDVEIVDPEVMSSFQLVGNVTMRPGTYLVKITTTPDVYAVEPDGVLRKIADEDMARDMYGPEWASRVRDVADVFWTNYQIGDALTQAMPTEGSVTVIDATGEVVYVENGTYYSMSGTVREALRFRSDFHAIMTDEMLEALTYGEQLTYSETIAYPY